MVRSFSCLLGLIAVGVPSPAFAVVKVARPLLGFIDESNIIVLVKVQEFHPDKPALVLNVQEGLKGKLAFRRLPVVAKLDTAAPNQNFVPAILKRLAVGQDLILFVNERGKKTLVFGFTNGSWFHMVGDRVDKDRVVWSLLSGEPMLRRTFKGSTAELRELVKDCLAKKKKAPEIDEKEPPGFGPASSTPQTRRVSEGAGRSLADASGWYWKSKASRSSGTHCAAGPLFGVIPTLGLGAPLAILAILFPAVFGGVLVLFRQWLAFITVFGVNSTLLLLYLWLGGALRGSWWGTEPGLWLAMTLVAFFGTAWAWRRQVHNLSLGAGAVEPPRRTETIVLLTLTALCGGLAAFLVVLRASFDVFDYFVFVLTFGISAGALVHLARQWFFSLSMSPGRSTEGVILSSALLASLAVGALRWGSEGDVAGTAESGTLPGGRVADLVGLRWSFKAKDSGLFVSAPLVDGDRVYAAAASPGFKVGTLYCLDRASGRKLWEFLGDGELKNMISSPCLADGRLYIGEGFHDDPSCKLWCVDAATGALIWHFQTKGQTESSPTVVAGKVYFGAGNDGLYCLDAETGKLIWSFAGEAGSRLLRFGAGPAVAGGRLYAATGIDRNKLNADAGETALLCLDAYNGKLIWKAPTNLPAWGAPVVSSGKIFLGTGNGDIFDNAKEHPLGALLCFDAQTGAEVWRCPVENGVLDRPAVDETSIYFGCRDGHVHCLDRGDGKRRWKAPLDSPVVAAPALAQWCGQTASVFAVATGGKICCLDPKSGALYWTYDLTDRKPHLSAAPKVVTNRSTEEDRRQIYVGAGIGAAVGGQAVLYCLEDKMTNR
jgi:outer membrane protein assembly factor BamB